MASSLQSDVRKPKCCTCNGVNARCKSCICVKLNRSCKNCHLGGCVNSCNQSAASSPSRHQESTTSACSQPLSKHSAGPVYSQPLTQSPTQLMQHLQPRASPQSPPLLSQPIYNQIWKTTPSPTLGVSSSVLILSSISILLVSLASTSQQFLFVAQFPHVVNKFFHLCRKFTWKDIPLVLSQARYYNSGFPSISILSVLIVSHL